VAPDQPTGFLAEGPAEGRAGALGGPERIAGLAVAGVARGFTGSVPGLLVTGWGTTGDGALGGPTRTFVGAVVVIGDFTAVEGEGVPAGS